MIVQLKLNPHQVDGFIVIAEGIAKVNTELDSTLTVPFVFAQNPYTMTYICAPADVKIEDFCPYPPEDDDEYTEWTDGDKKVQLHDFWYKFQSIATKLVLRLKSEPEGHKIEFTVNNGEITEKKDLSKTEIERAELIIRLAENATKQMKKAQANRKEKG